MAKYLFLPTRGKEWTQRNLHREFAMSSNKCKRNSLQDSVFIIGFMRGQSSLYSTKGNTYIIEKWGMRNLFFLIIGEEDQKIKKSKKKYLGSLWMVPRYLI